MSKIETLLTILRDNPWDALALVIFIFCWLGYEPFLKSIGKQVGVIRRDLSVIRAAWMREGAVRDVKLLDSNLMAHAVNSATHFSQANLILIAAVAGVLFGGHLQVSSAQALGFAITSPLLLQLKLALVIVCLARGLLNFIWALRQMNYCAAAMGSLPEHMSPAEGRDFGAALAQVLEPAMTNFSQGVRGYYFSLAGAAWLFGPLSLAVASIAAVVLLGWRQSRSQAAHGLRRLRELLEAREQGASAQIVGENIAPHNSKSDL